MEKYIAWLLLRQQCPAFEAGNYKYWFSGTGSCLWHKYIVEYKSINFKDTKTMQ